MEIRLAGHFGFCFGVKRAINIARRSLRELEKSERLYSLGPIIHNPQVVEELTGKGLQVIDSISKIKKGTLIISSHGAPIETVEKIKKKNIKLIDATCPFVKYAQDIVKFLKREGYKVVIVGDPLHPEVKALKSLIGKDKDAGKIGIVSQTTQNRDDFIKEIQRLLREGHFSEIRIFNTICKDTSRRQWEARRLLRECDLMVVVGGRNSANTRRLAEICKRGGISTLHIERDRELGRKHLRGKRCVGITSGASTPEELVKRVIDKIKMKGA